MAAEDSEKLFISTHTPLAGRDTNADMVITLLPPFLLTRPLRDVTNTRDSEATVGRFLLTRPLRDVT